MSVYDDRREELEKQEFMMGLKRGRLAVSLDLLTDALVLVGQQRAAAARSNLIRQAPDAAESDRSADGGEIEGWPRRPQGRGALSCRQE